MRIVIEIEDIGEGQCMASVGRDGHCPNVIQTPPQVCTPDALRFIGHLFAKAPVDVLYALEHNASFDRELAKQIQTRPY